jgi:DNA repair protein RadD
VARVRGAPYQRQALDALDAYWQNGGGHPLVAMATATGKSLVIAWLIRDLMQQCPDLRILALTHVQELIKQNVDHVLAVAGRATRNQLRRARQA